MQAAGNDPFEITLATQTHHSDEIKADFERETGCSIYSLLPGVEKNSFL